MDTKMPTEHIHQIKLLRQELQLTHKTYLDALKEKDIYIRDKEKSLSVFFDWVEDLKLEKKRLKEENRQLEIMNERKEKDHEKWKECAIKYQWIFEQMDRIKLPPDCLVEDIFECYKDIELPHITTVEKNKYVTTHLTGSEGDTNEEDEEAYRNSLLNIGFRTIAEYESDSSSDVVVEDDEEEDEEEDVDEDVEVVEVDEHAEVLNDDEMMMHADDDVVEDDEEEDEVEDDEDEDVEEDVTIQIASCALWVLDDSELDLDDYVPDEIILLNHLLDI
tara:strand:- start:3700 stop:4527 length:828 start_codon:yes stop_codon:yes gene_type:complete